MLWEQYVAPTSGNFENFMKIQSRPQPEEVPEGLTLQETEELLSNIMSGCPRASAYDVLKAALIVLIRTDQIYDSIIEFKMNNPNNNTMFFRVKILTNVHFASGGRGYDGTFDITT